MNWTRIWTGTVLAGVAFLGGDFILNEWVLGAAWKQAQLAGFVKPMRPYAFPIVVLIDLGIGFILTWLYALARPRLGPGPKTALQMGALAWFLIYAPAATAMFLWYRLPSAIPVTYLTGGLLQCWISIYLAGWQYIERAP